MIEGRPSYTVRAERGRDGWWLVTVPELKGVFTQARRLDEVEPMARDVVALMLDVPEESFDLRLEPVLPAATLEEVAAARRLKEEAERVQREASAAYVATARDLFHNAHLTTREIGSLLDVSFQRISQLLSETRGPRVHSELGRAATRVTPSKSPRKAARTSKTAPPREPIGAGHGRTGKGQKRQPDKG